MKKLLFILCILSITATLFSSCSALKAPIVIQHSSLKNYKYAYITPTTELTSSTGGAYGSAYGIYGSTMTKTINPSDVIAGELIKQGFIVVPEIKDEHVDQTIIVNYGESGRRNRGLGYTIEVTMQMISAKSHDVISVCTAEGQGSTEADDIRQAIRRALDALFKKD